MKNIGETDWILSKGVPNCLEPCGTAEPGIRIAQNYG